MNLVNLSNLQLDLLKEMGNIGAGHAATAMSQLTNKKIDMQVPSVTIVPFDDMMEMMGGPEQLIVATLFRIKGDIHGTVYFILSKDEAELLVDHMLPGQGVSLFYDNGLNEISISALQEVGNILTGSYLTALSDFLNINIQPSIPYFSIDMAGAIMTAGLIELSHITDVAIVIDTKMNEDARKEGINGQFFLVPDPQSLEKIFNILGIEQ